MSLLDQILVGHVIKDFGPIEERKIGIGKIKRSALLVERYGQIRFVLKTSATAFLAASVHYSDISLEAADKLQGFINESKFILASLPPLAPDVIKQAMRDATLTLAIAAIVTILMPDPIGVIITSVVAAMVHWSRITAVKKLPELEQQKETTLWLLLAMTLIIGLAKLAALWALG